MGTVWGRKEKQEMGRGGRGESEQEGASRKYI